MTVPFDVSVCRSLGPDTYSLGLAFHPETKLFSPPARYVPIKQFPNHMSLTLPDPAPEPRQIHANIDTSFRETRAIVRWRKAWWRCKG